MNSISIINLQNIGPFIDDISINFVGYLNGTIKIIDNSGKQLVQSDEFDHEKVNITISGIPKNKQFSAIVEAQSDPSFHGTYSSFISGQNSISSSDITDIQRGRYASVRISMIDQNGTSNVIHNASINSSFNIPLQSGRIYIYELLCGSGSGGTSACGDSGSGCSDVLINQFVYSLQKTAITKDDIPSAFFDENATVFTENRDKIRIYKIQDGNNQKSSVYLGAKDNSFSVSMQSGYTYFLYAECSCKSQDILKFDVSEYSDCDLTPYQDATQFGVQDGTPWRLIETGYPYKYFEGTVQNGKFEGLPNKFRPIKYTYTGHMVLQTGCFNSDVLEANCPWLSDYEFPECIQHESATFVSGQTVNLAPYQNTAQYGPLYDGMTWGLYDETHGVFVLHGVYVSGVLYETEGGETSVEVTSQSALRNSYTSTYTGDSTYKFVFRCDGHYPSYKFYVIGFCGKKVTDRELTDKEYFTGNLNTLYTVMEPQLYPPNSYYQDKRMNVLAGPFDTKTLADNHKNSYSSSLLATLNQQCQNRMTFDITWSGNDGCDLDISFLVEGIAMGWAQQNSSPYATWYGDNTSCSGAEQVSIDKNAMIAAGLKTTTVIIRAHWYWERYNGNCYLTVSDGTTSLMRTFNSTTQESSNQNYDTLGSVTINLEDDTFTISGGSGSEVSTRNALLASLPEDLR